MKSTIQTPQSLEELNEALTALKLKIALQEYQSETIDRKSTRLNSSH